MYNEYFSKFRIILNSSPTIRIWRLLIIQMKKNISEKNKIKKYKYQLHIYI